MTDADLVRKYVDIYNSGDAAALGVFYAADVVLVDPMSPEPMKGRETVLAVGSAFRRAFPDMVWTLTGDPVVGSGAIGWELHATGTMTGPMPGPDGEIPATGKTFAVDMGIFWTLGTDDLIVAEHAYFDSTGMLAQLGLTG
ncbi:ester cyclase [Kribbella sp. NBC_01245]|uniref:ester cyclase n=1 Tax=Kribbella sp. NBC_01245 TaxID=2903578 RepID=UPI002E2D247C|nr:ester cyclase [Kribbella sp. NBC_01245]